MWEEFSVTLSISNSNSNPCFFKSFFYFFLILKSSNIFNWVSTLLSKKRKGKKKKKKSILGYGCHTNGNLDITFVGGFDEFAWRILWWVGGLLVAQWKKYEILVMISNVCEIGYEWVIIVCDNWQALLLKLWNNEVSCWF